MSSTLPFRGGAEGHSLTRPATASLMRVRGGGRPIGTAGRASGRERLFRPARRGATRTGRRWLVARASSAHGGAWGAWASPPQGGRRQEDSEPSDGVKGSRVRRIWKVRHPPSLTGCPPWLRVVTQRTLLLSVSAARRGSAVAMSARSALTWGIGMQSGASVGSLGLPSDGPKVPTWRVICSLANVQLLRQPGTSRSACAASQLPQVGCQAAPCLVLGRGSVLPCGRKSNEGWSVSRSITRRASSAWAMR